MKNLMIISTLLLAFPVMAANRIISSASSTVGFEISNAGMAVDGKFTEVSGNIDIDPANLSAARVFATVKTASINTGIAMRDDHLRSKDYFDSDKFPSMTFVGSSCSIKDGVITLTGKLTIKDKSKIISMPVGTSTKGDLTIYSASFQIDRKEFGVGGNSWIMGDDVKVKLAIACK
ncbi:MAG: YceI family protein [Bacteroidetes bacterium]|jgi:polyisoprenoid-binding protein YceI|nr:YceI family protein [Bacteroidota bacterium]